MTRPLSRLSLKCPARISWLRTLGRWLRGYLPTPNADPVYLYIDNVVRIIADKRLNNGQPSGHAKPIKVVYRRGGMTLRGNVGVDAFADQARQALCLEWRGGFSERNARSANAYGVRRPCRVRPRANHGADW